MKKRATLLTMNAKAHRALWIEAAMAGFAASGKGFNGESFAVEKYPRIESMLKTHFNDLYEKKTKR